jgi:multiple sugar transport system ATP-binding protein
MVFQNYGLYPHMTIFENIAYPLRVRGIVKSEIKPRVEKAAEQVELTQFLDRKPKALSGGQRQRVALARAIVRTPKVFLMDEPLSNLDAKLRVTMRAELKHLSRELQITTVYVTHDQIEAMTLADRVAVMKHGIIQQLGTPDEIYNDPANLFVAGFIGSPAMNLINGSVKGGMFVTTGGTRLVTLDTPDRNEAILGVRADDMSVHDQGQGDIDVKIYAFENTGESTLLTVQWGKQRVIARGDRHLRKDQDDVVGISLNTDHLYLFDPETETRIRM